MATPTALEQMRKRNRKAEIDPLLKACQDAYKISETNYRDSIAEGRETIDMFHNRQYTESQLAKLMENGQPAETYNVIRMLSNAIIGYLDTVINTITVEPRYMSSAASALLLNDVVQYILDENDFETTNKRMKLDGLLTGLMACYLEVIPTGKTDAYGRKLYEIQVSHIPSWRLRLDPQSTLDDYSDARWIHDFKWVPEEELLDKFGQAKVDELTSYSNFLDEDNEADYDRQFKKGNDIGKHKQYENYLTVKTIITYKGDVWSVLWSNDTVLEKKKITFKHVKSPYRVIKLSNSDIAEYYGPLRDITETQKAINQALLQIQLLVNTSKALVEDQAVENLEEFRELFNRVNAIIPVVSLDGIRIEDMSRDIQQQYSIINNALDRIKAVLGINDAFLGTTFAADSGRKVQLNQASSASQLTMIVDRVKYLYKMIGTDIVALVQQYYRANQIFKIAEPINGMHFTEINKPIMMPIGTNPDGSIKSMPVWEEDINPETGEPETDEEGNILMSPLNTPDSDIEFAEVSIKVTATRGNNAAERNQLMLETFINGPAGQVLLQLNPAGYLRTLAMQISEFGTKHSIEVAKMLMDTALGIEQGKIDPRLAMVGGDIQAIMGQALGGSTGSYTNTKGPESKTLGLPKSGREGGAPSQGA